MSIFKNKIAGTRNSLMKIAFAVTVIAALSGCGSASVVKPSSKPEAGVAYVFGVVNLTKSRPEFFDLRLVLENVATKKQAYIEFGTTAVVGIAVEPATYKIIGYELVEALGGRTKGRLPMDLIIKEGKAPAKIFEEFTVEPGTIVYVGEHSGVTRFDPPSPEWARIDRTEVTGFEVNRTKFTERFPNFAGSRAPIAAKLHFVFEYPNRRFRGQVAII
ncbi:MAG: hypothetical protein NXI24_24815 [bacterium]|nr:hypothetical protein [bacterium]